MFSLVKIFCSKRSHLSTLITIFGRIFEMSFLTYHNAFEIIFKWFFAFCIFIILFSAKIHRIHNNLRDVLCIQFTYFPPQTFEGRWYHSNHFISSGRRIESSNKSFPSLGNIIFPKGMLYMAVCFIIFPTFVTVIYKSDFLSCCRHVCQFLKISLIFRSKACLFLFVSQLPCM